MQLSKIVFNFTDTQDVRVLAGYRANVNHRGEWTGVRLPWQHAAHHTSFATAHAVLCCWDGCNSVPWACSLCSMHKEGFESLVWLNVSTHANSVRGVPA